MSKKILELLQAKFGADYDAYAKRNFERFDAALAVYRTRFPRT